ncbi:3' exoribonuclease family, domain 1-domain-containing protein [Neohortaea acidophila]|uniref:3' exoribonuclease family, domain 1-domain-containing protein n=1 Tax=Neohortaea acidophila TaxID=245834 RepID=A0A6A6Q6P8_9PEZI|nr:3' exoribonuclease family, domain 1-domain-containing protein [Neohortaea acidophila]KAF2488118.1 3' exoribonuclease family, domain 1-domain-containing protein [Neohortaea acidophila]
MQADRRRINAPAGGTAPPVFTFTSNEQPPKRPRRTRGPDEHRKIFLRTGVVPSASGSAYYEIPPQPSSAQDEKLTPKSSSLKITCTVHGPRPLPRNAAFSPNLLLSTHVKFAPFATRRRRGYVRDASERDLGVHLETALRGVIIGDRWPKSGCEVVITILEGEEDGWWADGSGAEKGAGWGLMSVLAGCITVASAALVDAGIDCVDVVSGGISALVIDDDAKTEHVALDVSPPEHEIKAMCVVAYLQSRDEITECWLKGDASTNTEALMDAAVKAAAMSRTVLAEAIGEAATGQSESESTRASAKGKGKDVTMAG